MCVKCWKVSSIFSPWLLMGPFQSSGKLSSWQWCLFVAVVVVVVFALLKLNCAEFQNMRKSYFETKNARRHYISPWQRNQWATQVLLSSVSGSVKYSRIRENQWLCSDRSVCSVITLGLSCSSRCSTPQAAPLIATCELIYFHAGLSVLGICRGNSLERHCSCVLFTQNCMFKGTLVLMVGHCVCLQHVCWLSFNILRSFSRGTAGGGRGRKKEADIKTPDKPLTDRFIWARASVFTPV